MSEIVYYHLPGEKRFSLDFVNPDLATVEERQHDYDETAETTVESYELDETVYALYSRSGPTTTVDDLEYEFRSAFERMDRPTRIITRRIFDVFDGVVEQNVEEEGQVLEAYKYIEIEALPEAIQRTDWDSTAPDVGGQLLSNLILRHALPNANHRTAFGMLELYLEAVDRSFSMPSLETTTHDWQEWVDPFIVDSKRLLTVRRNVGPFRYLRDLGCDVVRRRGEIDIRLEEFDLDMSRHEALEVYARRHEVRSTEFVERLLRRAGMPELIECSGIRKPAFADVLGSTQN